MTDPRSVAVGGHVLPSLFSSAPPPSRRRRRGLFLGIGAGILVVAALGAVQLGANLRYDDAETALASSSERAADTVASVQTAVDGVRSATDASSRIVTGDSAGLVDDALEATLSAAITDADAVTTTADGLLDAELPVAGHKPTWFWELFGAGDRLDADRAAVDRLDAALQDEAPVIAEADATVSDAATSVLASAAAAAGAFEAAHISAKNDAVIALRDAATTVKAVSAIDSAAADSFAELQSAAATVVASEQQELAEKAGPLMSTRLEVEAFARSLAPGVLLEFDWSPVVNGAGGGGSMGGLTTWWWGGADRAVIELSNSVAERWPSFSSKSLVAHEVGHAISVKCEDMYDSSTQDSIEKWATAWAISMGYTDDANGVWAYGYPPQSYIDAAAGCR